MTEIDTLQGDVLINTTPVGMTPNTEVSPVPSAVLSRFSLVADVIYTPLRTRLLREAERAGCTVLSGVEMFVEQGAAQFRLCDRTGAPGGSDAAGCAQSTPSHRHRAEIAVLEGVT